MARIRRHVAAGLRAPHAGDKRRAFFPDVIAVDNFLALLQISADRRARASHAAATNASDAFPAVYRATATRYQLVLSWCTTPGDSSTQVRASITGLVDGVTTRVEPFFDW